MTKDEVNKLIRQVMKGSKPSELEGILYYQNQIIEIAKLVAEHERAACAKVCEELRFSKAGPSHDALRQRLLCADAIRARGES